MSYLCLQLAYHMGFRDVYLLGFDHSYVVPADARLDGNRIETTSTDPNHFHPDYFGKGLRWHQPRVDRMEIAYIRARQHFEYADRTVWNATVGGQLEVFPRVAYDALFRGRSAAARRPRRPRPPRGLITRRNRCRPSASPRSSRCATIPSVCAARTTARSAARRCSTTSCARCWRARRSTA